MSLSSQAEKYHIKGLTDLSTSNLRADKHASTLSSGDVQIVLGDGRQGYAPAAPYDVIHVGAAAPTMPLSLVEQLKPGGRLFIPVGTDSQDVWTVDKTLEGEIKSERLFSVRYVPLTDAPGMTKSDLY